MTLVQHLRQLLAGSRRRRQAADFRSWHIRDGASRSCERPLSVDQFREVTDSNWPLAARLKQLLPHPLQHGPDIPSAR